MVGMLSISQTEKLPPKLAVKASLKKKAAEINRMADEKINKVHQDDDFIYPTLGNQDLILYHSILYSVPFRSI